MGAAEMSLSSKTTMFLTCDGCGNEATFELTEGEGPDSPEVDDRMDKDLSKWGFIQMMAREPDPKTGNRMYIGDSFEEREDICPACILKMRNCWLNL
jgi:hypothetical protein